MPYVLIMYCPSLSARFGNHGSEDISPSDRLGGFAILQFEADELDDPAINRSIFQSLKASKTMTSTYGSNMTGFSSGGFVWAGEITSSIIAPRATLVGSMYQGCINYAQLYNTDDSESSHLDAGASLNDLIDISKVANCQKSFTMRSAVVNNNIVNMA